MPARPDAPLAEYLYLLAGDPEDFVAACADLLPADIVEALNDLPPEAASKVVGALPFHTAVEVFDQAELEARDEIVERLPDDIAAPLVQAMSADQQVRLFRSIKGSDRARLGYCLDAPTRDQLKLLLSYPPQSAGGLMTTEFVSVPSTWTAAQVRQLVHDVGSAKETVYAIYVLDEKTQRLQQVISLREVMTASDTTLIKEIGDSRKPVTTRPLTDREEVARLIAKYNLLAIPVVDEANHVLGIVTVDDVIDALVKEQTEDVQKFGGLEALDEPYMEIGLPQMIRKRAGWLCALVPG